jgi:methyl-accepting chemotaxis protein
VRQHQRALSIGDRLFYGLLERIDVHKVWPVAVMAQMKADSSRAIAVTTIVGRLPFRVSVRMLFGVQEISATIAYAVEEQGAATQEISRKVQQAAQGTREVSANVGDVQRGASETGSASSRLLSAAQSLSRDSNRLKLEVGKFLDTVRAA